MLNLKDLLISTSSLMTVSGFERFDRRALLGLFSPHFDETQEYGNGNYIFIKRCGKLNAPRILIDTHIDQAGMITAEVRGDGFLGVTAVGGPDARLLPSCEMMVYPGLRRGDVPGIYGVFASVPPHLRGSDSGKVTPAEELALDVGSGYTKGELERLIPPGTPVAFRQNFTELMNNRFAAAGFDNRACAAAALYAVSNTDRGRLAGDVYLLLSAQEETCHLGGKTGAVAVDPDYALIADVCHGLAPGTKKSRAYPLGGGAAVTLSAVVGRKLTGELLDAAAARGIKHQIELSPMNTGTNASAINLACSGIPCAVVSWPLRNMHGCLELLDLSDGESLSDMIVEFITNESIAEKFAGDRDERALIRGHVESIGRNPVIPPQKPCDLSAAALTRFSFLKKLSETFGPSGCEEAVAELIRDHIGALCDEMRTDRLGNIIALIKGKSDAPAKLMLSAHMDEVGFMITEIDDDGFLRLAAIGGIDPAVLTGRRVVIAASGGGDIVYLKGIIGSKPPHLQEKDEREQYVSIDKLYIDIGADSRSDAEKRVRPGDFAAFDTEFVIFGSDYNRLRGGALDDRLGCAVLCEVMKSLRQNRPEADVYFAFTVREEVGLSGALTAAGQIAPDYAIVIETTAVADIAGVPPHKRVAALGCGGALSFADNSTVYDRGFTEFIKKTADSHGILCQYKQYKSGGNDAAHIQRSGSGVRVAALSAPSRYIHSQSCVCDSRDYEAMVALLVRVIGGVNDFLG